MREAVRTSVQDSACISRVALLLSIAVQVGGAVPKECGGGALDTGDWSFSF